MNRDMLVESAKKLKQPSEKSTGEYSGKRAKIAAEMNILMEARKDILELTGNNNLEMMKDNNNNHSMFMDSLFTAFNPEVIADTVIWVFKVYGSHGFGDLYFSATLEGWLTVLKKELSPEAYDEIYPFYKWMIVNIPAFAELAGEKK
ncbi:MAG: hypothetical protein JXR81_10460 [Candidatus Goldbacteria bacterium]|nr:hypothetical protein [Candidatus Goldiibacteriota bacterium]